MKKIIQVLLFGTTPEVQKLKIELRQLDMLLEYQQTLRNEYIKLPAGQK